MQLPRLKFTVGNMLLFFATIALLLRFSPHILWKAGRTDISSGVIAIPSMPLAQSRLDDDSRVSCQVGPVSFEIPHSMANNIGVHRGIGGGFLRLQNEDCSVLVQLPKRNDPSLQGLLNDFPEKANLTFPRLYKEITDAKSSDFSWGMSYKELEWHKWLLSTRADMAWMNIDSVEFLSTPKLEGNLVASSSGHAFQWSTVDSKWNGVIHFNGSTASDAKWIRILCSTFTINGDPEMLRGYDEAAIKTMIIIREVGDEK